MNNRITKAIQITVKMHMNSHLRVHLISKGVNLTTLLRGCPEKMLNVLKEATKPPQYHQTSAMKITDLCPMPSPARTILTRTRFHRTFALKA